MILFWNKARYIILGNNRKHSYCTSHTTSSICDMDFWMEKRSDYFEIYIVLYPVPKSQIMMMWQVYDRRKGSLCLLYFYFLTPNNPQVPYFNDQISDRFSIIFYFFLFLGGNNRYTATTDYMNGIVYMMHYLSNKK